jgi:hypothetical protein
VVLERHALGEEAAMTALEELRARRHATAIAERCDFCGEDGRHDAECPEWTCGHGVKGSCAYCKGLTPADDGPDED